MFKIFKKYRMMKAVKFVEDMMYSIADGNKLVVTDLTPHLNDHRELSVINKSFNINALIIIDVDIDTFVLSLKVRYSTPLGKDALETLKRHAPKDRTFSYDFIKHDFESFDVQVLKFLSAALDLNDLELIL